jgi:cytochrome P450
MEQQADPAPASAAGRYRPDPYDHHRPLDQWDPEAAHAQLRGECPMVHTPSHGGYWVVTSHDLVRQCGRDPQAFSSEHDLDGSGLGTEFGGIAIPPQGRYRSIPSEIDGGAFHQYRRLLLPWFTQAATARWLPIVRAMTSEILDRHLESGSIDLVLDLANPVPAMVTMSLVGLDPDQWEQFAGPLHSLVFAPPQSPTWLAALEEIGHLRAALLDLVLARRQVPAEDVASAVMAAEIDGKLVSDADAVNVLFTVVAGGVDTTTALIANALLWLSEHPDTRRRLIEEPSLRSSAREEFLRVFSPAPATARTATGAVRIGGQDLDRGERVLLSWAAANRDPVIFEQPDRVDVTRDSRQHVAFGFGPHRCIGAPLARATFDGVLDVVLDTIGDYVVDLPGAVRYPRVGAVNGWVSIPARFDSRK